MDTVNGGSYSVLQVQQDLKRLRTGAGEPSFAKIARTITENRRRRGLPESEALVSRSTVYDCFGISRKRLDVDLVLDILRALDLEATELGPWQRKLEIALGYASACSVVSVSDQLPHRHLPFVGREEQLRTISEQIRTGQGGIIWVSGMPGVGKSALVMHAAHGLQTADGKNLTLVTDLRGFSSQGPPADSRAVVDALLRQLGKSPHTLRSDESRRQTLRQALREAPHLVILDDAADAQQVTGIFSEVAGLQILVTSRSAAPLPEGALHIPLGPLTEDEAVDMLGSITGAQRLRAEPEAGRELSEVTGYLPLALQLTGARITTNHQWSLADHVELAQSRRRALRVDDAVAEAFDPTYQALAEDSQVMLRLLAIHPVALMEHSSAVALAQGVILDPERALADLVDHSMLTQPRPQQYGLHELLRVHAADLSLEQDSPSWRRTARARLNHHVVSRLWSAHRMLILDQGGAPRQPRGDVSMQDLTDQEAQTFLSESLDLLLLVAYADSSDAQGLEPLVSVSEAINGWLYRAGRLHEAVALHQEALRRAVAAGDQVGQVRATVDVARTMGHSGEYKPAQDMLLKVEHLVTELGEEEIVFNNALGTLSDRLGESTAAEQRLLRTVQLAEAAGDLKHVSYGWNNLAGVYARLGRDEDAVHALQRSVEVARTTGDQHGIARGAVNQSYLLLNMQRYEEAEAAAQEGLNSFEAMGIPEGALVARSNIAASLNSRDQWDHALTWYREALKAARDLGMIQHQLTMLNGMAFSYVALGDVQLAERTARDALTISGEVDDPVTEGISYLMLGDALAAQERSDQAQHQFRQALLLFEKAQSPRAEEARERLA